MAYVLVKIKNEQFSSYLVNLANSNNIAEQQISLANLAVILQSINIQPFVTYYSCSNLNEAKNARLNAPTSQTETWIILEYQPKSSDQITITSYIDSKNTYPFQPSFEINAKVPGYFLIKIRSVTNLASALKVVDLQPFVRNCSYSN